MEKGDFTFCVHDYITHLLYVLVQINRWHGMVSNAIDIKMRIMYWYINEGSKHDLQPFR